MYHSYMYTVYCRIASVLNNVPFLHVYTVPTVSLASTEFVAFENTSTAVVTITREGDLSSTVSVRIKTTELSDSAIGKSGVTVI